MKIQEIQENSCSCHDCLGNCGFDARFVGCLNDNIELPVRAYGHGHGSLDFFLSDGTRWGDQEREDIPLNDLVWGESWEEVE